MIAEAFAFVQFPILPLVKLPTENGDGEKMQLFRRNPKLCTPSDFDYSPYFKIIKYPFIDIHYHDSHHLLPWHGSRVLEEDEASHYLTNEGVPKDHEVQQAIEEAVAVTRAAEVTAAEKNDISQDAAAESSDKQMIQKKAATNTALDKETSTD